MIITLCSYIGISKAKLARRGRPVYGFEVYENYSSNDGLRLGGEMKQLLLKGEPEIVCNFLKAESAHGFVIKEAPHLNGLGISPIGTDTELYIHSKGASDQSGCCQIHGHFLLEYDPKILTNESFPHYLEHELWHAYLMSVLPKNCLGFWQGDFSCQNMFKLVGLPSLFWDGYDHFLLILTAIFSGRSEFAINDVELRIRTTFEDLKKNNNKPGRQNIIPSLYLYLLFYCVFPLQLHGYSTEAENNIKTIEAELLGGNLGLSKNSHNIYYSLGRELFESCVINTNDVGLDGVSDRLVPIWQRYAELVPSV